MGRVAAQQGEGVAAGVLTVEIDYVLKFGNYFSKLIVKPIGNSRIRTGNSDIALK
jgi:hypothetical protein